ncbi:MAG TPA: hypothetical protein VHA52_12345, partial [Candidatus Babeliaceae bacterium]|nr:hypothetical protein [Candidatus Babeliaceae bacterium]
YRFRLTATDNAGNTSYAEVVIAVNSVYPNKEDTVLSTTTSGYHFIAIDFDQDPGYKKDTISILGGTYTYVDIKNLLGDPDKRIIIRPLGGPVTVTQPDPYGQTSIVFTNCQYVHVDGRLPDETYGFKLIGPLDSRWGQVFITGRSKCMEVNNIYGHYMSYGFQIKNDPGCDPISWNDNEAKTFVMDSFDLHHFYFDSTYYEGTYIGGTLNTSSTTYDGIGGYWAACSGDTSYHFGYRMGHIKIHDGTITNTTNDGIQVVDVRYGNVEIYNMRITNLGNNGNSQQDHAMSLGGFMQADIHDNYIDSAGFGIFLNGTGDITFRNDTIKNIQDGDAIYISNNKDTLYQILNADSMVIRAYNNYINGANYGINLTNYDRLLAKENQIYNNNISNTKNQGFTYNNDPSIVWQGEYGGGTLDTTLSAKPFVKIENVDIGSGSLTIHATASQNGIIKYSIDGKKWQTDSTFSDLATGWYIASAEITPYTRDNRNQIYITNTGIENTPPTANAGNDTTIILPINSITLDGGKSFDPDGTISSFLWQEVSGPSKLTFSKVNSKNLTATDLQRGA